MPRVHIKGSKSPGLHVKEGARKNSGKTEMVKGTKLVIHLGAKIEMHLVLQTQKLQAVTRIKMLMP